MSGVTNDLIRKSEKISNDFDVQELDVLLSTGEQIACSLLAGRLRHLGYNSRSWLAWQIPIITSGDYNSSRIININKNRIHKYLKSNGIPIITGFQGINNKSRVTTLGRGGSDTSAIMVAKFFKANKCIIYTDVEGVMTTDPKIHKKANKIKITSFTTMSALKKSDIRVNSSFT